VTTAVSVEEQLRAVPLFAAASSQELERIARVVRPASFSRGRTICAEGVFGVGMHVITEGWVQVQATHAPETRLGPGAYFGEMAVLDGGPRMATVTAVTDVRTLVLDGYDLAKILDEQPAVVRKLLEHLCQRLRDQAANVNQ
jgi:CRP/FNR family transcriptional regulator, cyclic AMP receptor protein